MEKTYKCPKCGETENLHYNYDWPIPNSIGKYTDIFCNECGEYFEDNIEYPELEGTNALCNDKIWDNIYDEYSTEQYPPFGGPFTNSLSFIDWLKQNYKAPERT